MNFLNKIGFTKYESEIINFLSKIGRASAMEISKSTKIPPNKVYQTIQNLQKQNLIKHTNSQPKTYSLSNINEKLKEKIKTREREIVELENSYEEFVSKNQPETLSEDFWIINGRETLLKKTEESVSNINKDTVALIESWIAKYSTLKAAKSSIDRGKSIRFMGIIKKDDLPSVKKWLQIGIRVRKLEVKENVGFSVFDNSEVKISIYDDKLKSVWCENKNLAILLRNYYEILWERGEEITLENIKELEKSLSK